VFGYLKRGYIIELAYNHWRREAGIDFKAEVSKLPVSERTEYRNTLRESQKDMGASEHEVAVLMVLPFMQYLDANARGVVSDVVNGWSHRGWVRPNVQALFKQMLYGG
jgi:hypothetical protein